MLRVGGVKAAPRIPFRALVTVGGNAAGVFEHPRHMQQIPGHEGGVAVGEIVLRPARAFIEVRGPRPGLTQPAGIGLRRDGITDVLQGVQNVHRAMLGAVLVAGNQTAADLAVIGVLAGLVENAG